MSLQFSTAPGALVALGVGAGDVASIISLSRRLGNWWSGPSGDNDLLRLLDEDALNLFKRRGLMDILAFNKRWRKHIRLLGNGVPLDLHEANIEDVLKDTEKLVEELPLFTAVMTCLVAVLDQFASRSVVQALLQKVLKALFNPVEEGLEILRSHYISRLNAWRSMACFRGFTQAVETLKLQLLANAHILPGNMPASESPHMENFILWLLQTNETSFHTVSSDVAGVAACLYSLGMDVLCVERDGLMSNPHGCCRLIYSEMPFFRDPTSRARVSRAMLHRNATMVVPLNHPSESISVFPITPEAQSFCRLAWDEGIKAAKAVVIGVQKQIAESASSIIVNIEDPAALFTDIQYIIADEGQPLDRTSSDMMNLAQSFGLVLNQELIEGLSNALRPLSRDLLPWLIATTRGDRRAISGGFGISDPEMVDESRINGFCVFQSFFMGYYYDVFGRLVDTSTLASQTVDGCWGFRSEGFLRYMEDTKRGLHSTKATTHSLVLSRQQVLPLLARLYLGSDEYRDFIDDPENGTTRRSYMGIIGKRTLLINSLLGKCASPSEIGGFTILDVDVGGIPRDSEGLICPGIRTEYLETDFMDQERLAKATQSVVRERSSDEDVSFNIEPDWDGNPDTTLVCVRYKGRRITVMSPLISDWHFMRCYVPSTPGNLTISSINRSRLETAIEMTISNLLGDDSMLLGSGCEEVPVLFQALDRPCLRYCIASLYKDSMVECFIATDSIAGAYQRALEWYERAK